MGITIKTDKPCAVFAEVIEQAAIDQFESAMAQGCVTRGALMPDAHAGYTLPIGSVVETKGMIFPSWVGYDIGCGMCALSTTFEKDEVSKNSKSIFDAIYKAVPVGFSHNALPVKWDGWEDRRQTDKMREVFSKNGLQQLGTLGGGNHFIEIGSDEKGVVWIVTHSGSRGIGHAMASHYMRLASGDGKAREGHFGFSVESPNGLNYIEDLSFCLDFALANRREIIRRVELVLKEYSCGFGNWETLINRNHNHAEERDGMWIHRKGATHAEDGMMGVIPGNMRDGSFIVRGKGNPSALFSSSHGAGRVMGRKEAQRVLSAESFAKEMIGIEAKVAAETLDESPSAYKDIFAVMEQQKDLVDVIAHEKPIINIKG